MFNKGGAAVQVQDRSTPSGPLGLPSLGMGQRACSDHARSLFSHAGEGACWAPKSRWTASAHDVRISYEAHVSVSGT